MDRYHVGVLTLERENLNDPIQLISGVTMEQALNLMRGLEKFNQEDYSGLFDLESTPAFADGWEVVWSANGRRWMMDMDSWVEIK